ncbi:hypothetical protein NLX83_20200 [Allokutzneria sp. A3M-2-11 16]|uniref:hypothetical protein n=1 Tax=Allokutzneria sp. A3M-2-11 16 TaxID=2962043 RepID=UPI0020B8564B|nr:hypothetical protein [Allokutzneria sp. A3M-2-11 16]MCP3801586.1 hypothetical protein [Allokutzneria sp. A3M-2-11 16]
MLVAFLMTLYAGILSPLDSGVQSTDTTSTLSAPMQQVQAPPSHKPCDIAWPFCQPPNPKSAVAELAMDPGGIGNPGGIEWPDSLGTTLASSRPPKTGPGVEWPNS